MDLGGLSRWLMSDVELSFVFAVVVLFFLYRVDVFG